MSIKNIIYENWNFYDLKIGYNRGITGTIIADYFNLLHTGDVFFIDRINDTLLISIHAYNKRIFEGRPEEEAIGLYIIIEFLKKNEIIDSSFNKISIKLENEIMRSFRKYPFNGNYSQTSGLLLYGYYFSKFKRRYSTQINQIIDQLFFISHTNQTAVFWKNPIFNNLVLNNAVHGCQCILNFLIYCKSINVHHERLDQMIFNGQDFIIKQLQKDKVGSEIIQEIYERGTATKNIQITYGTLNILTSMLLYSREYISIENYRFIQNNFEFSLNCIKNYKFENLSISYGKTGVMLLLDKMSRSGFFNSKIADINKIHTSELLDEISQGVKNNYIYNFSDGFAGILAGYLAIKLKKGVLLDSFLHWN